MATRIFAISDPGDVAEPDYAENLRVALGAALDYGISAVERSEERPPPIPPVLLTQAHIAARNGVSLDTVLRRYFAGYTLLGDFLMQEARDGGLFQDHELQRVLRTQAACFDHLVEAVTDGYVRESASRLDGIEERRVEHVRRLLAGELLDTSELDCDFDGHHIGAVAVGPRAGEAIRDLAKALDRRLLLVRRDERIHWAWLGGRARLELGNVERVVSRVWPAQVPLGLGEAAESLSGWRATHYQAIAAVSIALRSSPPFARYADVALLASILQDDLFTASLRDLYLDPLTCESDGGEVLRQTLRAYFKAERNVSSAAALLGITRQAVAKRLRLAEAKLGRSLGVCCVELEAALRLDAFSRSKTVT